MEYFFTARRRSQGRYTDSIGPIRYLAVPEDQPITPDFEKSPGAWFDEVQAAAGGLRSSHGNIVFYVHGFNTEQAEMRARHRKIAHGLRANNFGCVLVSFDWPSDGDLFSYFDDRQDARLAANHLLNQGIEPLAERQEPDCVVDIHIIAHSMGCFLVREAFDYADDRHRVAQTNWTVAQVAFVAADVSAKSMALGNPKSSSLLRHTTRLTNYYSPFDEILSISSTKRIGVSRRLGRIGLPELRDEKAVNLYCGGHYELTRGAYSGTGASHWWYFEAPRFYEDLAHTLSGALDRNAIPGRSPTTGGNLALMPVVAETLVV